MVMALFLRSHNAQIKGTSLFAPVNTKESEIYYDKIMKSEKNSYNRYCCGLLKIRKSKVDKKENGSSDSSDLD